MEGDARPLEIGLALRGRVRAQRGADPRVVDLYAAASRTALRVELAAVRDAAGVALPARLARRGGGLALVVEDAGAEYPLVAIATLGASSWTSDGGQQDAFHGVAVAGDGDLDGDGYGDVVIGAFQYDDLHAEGGRAVVHPGGDAGPSSGPAWTRYGGQELAFFGRRVAIAGDVNADGHDDLLVAASHWDGSFEDEGRVEAFHGSASGAAPSTSWSVRGEQAGAALGLWIAPAGDVDGDGYDDVLVAAPTFDVGDLADAGEVRLYRGSAAGLELIPSWSARGAAADELLGLAADGAGDVDGDGYDDVLVGAPRHSGAGGSVSRFLLFRGGPAGPSATADLVVEGPQDGALFGGTLAGVGDADGDGYDDVLVGARLFDGGQAEEGWLGLYLGGSQGLASTPAWTMEGGQAGASLGMSVAGAGDINADGFADALAGVHLWDADGDGTDHGRALVLLGGASGLLDAPGFEVVGDAAGSRLGYAAGAAGDVDGDGRPDVVIGAHYRSGAFPREGRAAVHYGPLVSPPPPLGDTLRVRREGEDVLLSWQEPPPAAGSGPVTFFRVRRDTEAAGLFPELATTPDLQYRDAGAGRPGEDFLGWIVSAENADR